MPRNWIYIDIGRCVSFPYYVLQNTPSGASWFHTIQWPRHVAVASSVAQQGEDRRGRADSEFYPNRGHDDVMDGSLSGIHQVAAVSMETRVSGAARVRRIWIWMVQFIVQRYVLNHNGVVYFFHLNLQHVQTCR
jgi:hypothetical protein